MRAEDWIKNNRATFDSEYEALFAKQVLPLVAGLKWDTVAVQYPFVDSDGKNRYCDFTIIESQAVRVAIEIDGYDKRGTGQGMSHNDFLDWQRRQASLASQGWYVLRFANRDVRDAPQMCAKHITSLLQRLRQAQTGHIEIVTIQPSEAVSAATSQGHEEPKSQKSKVALIAGLCSLVFFASWQMKDYSFERGTDKEPGTLVVKESSYTDIAAKPRLTNQVSTVPAYGALDCKNPQDWATAKNHIGQVITVIGPFLDSRPRPDIAGSPLWMDVGNIYPQRNRLTVVLWGQNWDKFEIPKLDADSWTKISRDGLEKASICITGKVSEYKGIPQIELSSPDQIRIGL